MRNMLATLFLSQGVPMLQAGDEFARTQRGNNNAYCQDNEISWVDWRLRAANADLLEFVRLLARLRRAPRRIPARDVSQGRGARAPGVKDVTWLHPRGARDDRRRTGRTPSCAHSASGSARGQKPRAGCCSC